jgi:hypothetical protein
MNRGFFLFPVLRLIASVQIDHFTFDIDDVGLKHLRLGVLDDAVHHLRSMTRSLTYYGDSDQRRFEAVLIPYFSDAGLKSVPEPIYQRPDHLPFALQGSIVV